MTIRSFLTKRFALALAAGIIVVSIAFVAGRWTVQRPAVDHDHAPLSSQPARPQQYTCSMHPQVRSTDPDDQCPICGMDLIPVPADDEEDDPDGLPRLRLSRQAAALMDIRTWPVERRSVSLELRLFGKIGFDETRLFDVVARTEGYVEKLSANTPWQPVRKGEILAEMYSPSVVAAMHELLVAKDRSPTVLEAVRARLQRLGVTSEQIDRVLQTSAVPPLFQVLSPATGLLQSVAVRQGEWLREGGRLWRIADLSQVWVAMEAYESELVWLRPGQSVQFAVAALPGQSFTGTITYIDPVVDQRTRTVRVRVEAPNRDGDLKPGMFVTGQVQAPYEAPETPLIIPVSAPLITGRRALVYVQSQEPDDERPTFTARQVTLGPRAGAHYIVYEGLHEGERVVVNGQFKIDSELQLRGRPSMMAPAGGSPPAHHHHAPQDDAPPAATAPPAQSPPERVETHAAFRRRLGGLVQANFAIVAALAGDDPQAAQQAAAATLEQLADLRTEELAASARSFWEPRAQRLAEALAQLSGEPGLAEQRRAFERFSDALTEAVELFGMETETPVYRAMCPMVEGREGFWLQADETIANPYFGAAMLRCGEIVESLADGEPAP